MNIKLTTLLMVLLVSNSLSCQNNYLEKEKSDALKFSEIESLIFEEMKFDEALLMLDSILVNMPKNYRQIQEKQKRFWNKNEYLEYIEKNNDDISIPFILDCIY